MIKNQSRTVRDGAFVLGGGDLGVTFGAGNLVGSVRLLHGLDLLRLFLSGFHRHLGAKAYSRVAALAILLLVTTCTLPSSAATWTVKTAGGDFASIAAANASASVNNGDTLVVYPNVVEPASTTVTKQLTINAQTPCTNTGTELNASGNLVPVAGLRAGTPATGGGDANEPTCTATITTAFGVNADNVTLNGFEFTVPGATDNSGLSAFCFIINNRSNLLITNSYFHGCSTITALRIGASGDPMSTCTNCSVTHSTFSWAGGLKPTAWGGTCNPGVNNCGGGTMTLEMNGNGVKSEWNVIQHFSDGHHFGGNNISGRYNWFAFCGSTDTAQCLADFPSGGEAHADIYELSCSTSGSPLPVTNVLLEGNVVAWNFSQAAGPVSNGHFTLLQDNLAALCGNYHGISRFNLVIDTDALDQGSNAGNTWPRWYAYNNTVANGQPRYTDATKPNTVQGPQNGVFWGFKNNLLYNVIGNTNLTYWTFASTAPVITAADLDAGYNMDYQVPATYCAAGTCTYVNPEAATCQPAVGSGTSYCNQATPTFVSASDYHAAGGAPQIAAGGPLTTTTNTGTGSTALTVANADYFQDWMSTKDTICVGTVSNCAAISSITASVTPTTAPTTSITLASALTWSNAANVWLKLDSGNIDRLTGAAPNIGAFGAGATAPTCTLSASPLVIKTGASSTLTFTPSNTPTTCSINQGVGAVNCAGDTKSVSPTTATTYTATVSNASGTNTCSATVTIGGVATGANTIRTANTVIQ